VIQLYTHITDNIFCINVELPGSALKNTNAYLIKGEDRNLLIDTGFPQAACLRALNAGLSELGVTMSETDIFLTHLHSDHTGLVPQIAEKDTQIYMSAKDCDLIGFPATQSGLDTLIAEQKLSGFSDAHVRAFFSGPSHRLFAGRMPDIRRLDDGAILSYGGRKLRAILTPGHTPGHMCLYDAADRVMFLGDHVLFDITPNIVTWRGFPDPLGKYVSSLLDISGYDVSIPLPGHRGVSGTLPDRIGAIIEHHGRRIKELADVLDAYPDSTAYQLAGHLSWNIRFDGEWENFPLEQKYFAVGETKAHLEYLEVRGRAVKERRGECFYYFPPNMKRAGL
jgi:glyoxylase-like metal-dependent hydrolase (beta-lactamase superfamily II)